MANDDIVVPQHVIEKNIESWHIPQPDKEYTVVINCAAYNHGVYIEDALKGFVMQQCTYPFCAVVIDDGSSDNTADIIRKYAREYPDIIKPICLGENHMQHRKSRNPYFIKWHEAAKYIAYCEGDDYWTDSNKLQKQVDFMESNPEYSMCFHNAYIHWENSDKKDEIFKQLETREYTKEEIHRNWMVVPTASILLRREILDSEWFQKIRNQRFMSSDLTMCIIAGIHGRIHCFENIMSVYRRHESGMSYTIEANRLEFIKDRLKYTMFGGQIAKDAKKIVADCYKLFILDTLKDGKKADAIKLMFSMLWDVPSEFFKTWGGYLAYKIKK